MKAKIWRLLRRNGPYIFMRKINTSQNPSSTIYAYDSQLNKNTNNQLNITFFLQTTEEFWWLLSSNKTNANTAMGVGGAWNLKIWSCKQVILAEHVYLVSYNGVANHVKMSSLCIHPVNLILDYSLGKVKLMGFSSSVLCLLAPFLLPVPVKRSQNHCNFLEFST